MSIDFSGCSECTSLGQHEFGRIACSRCPAPTSSPPRRLLASPRLGQVPGTDFQPGPQIASIPPRPWQVPGTDFHLPPRPGQVPGTDFHLAPIWPHRFGRRIDTLGSEPQATVDPPRRMPGARPWAGAWHRFGRRIDTLGSEPQATVDPPRRMPGVLGAPGTGFLVLTDRTD
jgi:hypothetical protein